MSTRRRLLAMSAFGLALLCVVVVIVFGFPTLRNGGESDSSLRACTENARHVVLPFGAESSAGRWESTSRFPIAQDELRSAAIGDTVYIGTGLRQSGSELVSTGVFYAFDPMRGTYRKLPPLPRRVDHPALVASDGDLYLIGGYHDWLNPSAEAFRFSPVTGAWTELPPMATPRGSPAATAIGAKIYVAGGAVGTEESDRGPTGELEIFDTGTGSWSSGPPMPTPRHHAGAAAGSGAMYVVGGRNDDELSLDTVERFDPRTRRWRTEAPLPLGVGAPAVIDSGGRVIVVGGGDDDDDEGWVSPATWSFDPASNAWKRLPDLRTARHGHAVAAIGRTLYVFGGAPCPGYGYTRTVEKLPLG